MFFIENSKVSYLITALFLLLLSVFYPISSHALEPFEILVVANSREQDGVELARFYMKERNIPENYLLILHTAVNEGISRHIYENEIAEPIREFLVDKPKISCLVLLYSSQRFRTSCKDGHVKSIFKPNYKQLLHLSHWE